MILTQEYIKSPLNYTGNKSRILNQIYPFFPKKIGTMVDLFCGGCSVGLNANAEKVYFIDYNPRVIGLLKFLVKQNYDVLLQQLCKIAENYNLSISFLNGYRYYIEKAKPLNKNNGLKEYNKDGFAELKNNYNSLADWDSDDANKMLYLLLLYGFNNDLRFNKNGEYNLPCGKTDLNNSNLKKLSSFLSRVKDINATFLVDDFKSSTTKKILFDADFVYLDPPYLITDAVYNENNQWNVKKEEDLLNLLLELKERRISFILSNVLSKKDNVNLPLVKWLNENPDVEIINIDYHYRGASYNKKNRDAEEQEVIILFKGELYD